MPLDVIRIEATLQEKNARINHMGKRILELEKEIADLRGKTDGQKASVSDADKVKALMSVIDNVGNFIDERIENHLGELRQLIRRAKRIKNARTPGALEKEEEWIL